MRALMSPDEYRTKAATLRERAEAVGTLELKEQLRRVASQYEALAREKEWIERYYARQKR